LKEKVLTLEHKFWIAGAREAEKRPLIEVINELEAADQNNLESGSRIQELVTAGKTGMPIKLNGSLERIGRPKPYRNGDEAADVIRISVRDSDGSTLECLPILDKSLQQYLRVANSQLTFTFTGALVIYRDDYHLLVFNIREAKENLGRIEASQSEKGDAHTLIGKLLTEHGTIHQGIVAQLAETIGIRELDKASKLRDSLEFIVLQALSDGYEPQTNGTMRLHSLIVGPPAVGKKLLVEAAKILNVSFQEGQPGKLTAAGLVGATRVTKAGWISQPGLLPLADGGVFAMQDFHDVPAKRNLMGIFSKVMEDGEVIDSSSGMARHKACTSIHLDMNWKNEVYKNKDVDHTVEDLGIPIHILSRFDYIAEFERNLDLQKCISGAMNSSAQHADPSGLDNEELEMRRQLKVLVAHLKDAFAAISIPRNLAYGYLQEQWASMVSVWEQRLSRPEFLSDFLTRLSKSYKKMVFASARANSRSEATQDDIDIATKFLKIKMDFILKLLAGLPDESSLGVSRAVDNANARKAFIVARFGGKRISVDELKLVLDEENFGASAPTIYRDLKEVGKPVERGLFLITSAEKENQTRHVLATLVE
jgi:hypothetical protein